MKFVHAADVHLDSPLRGLASYRDAPVTKLRAATRRALENLVELCLVERAELLVLSGDLYDGDWRDYATGLFFVSQMARLRDAGVQVVSIRGNHDAASEISKRLRLPDNVRELSAERAESVTFAKLGVAVHGQSFASREVTTNLAQSYPERIPSLLNIGLLHTAVNGRAGHAPYAPCSLVELQNKGYEYWALGHVHTREELSREPWVVFPGNLQARHIREAGDKGATLVHYDASGIRSVTHRALDVVRYALCNVDVSSARSFDDALDLARSALDAQLAQAEGRTLAVRMRLFGETPVHARLRGDQDVLESELRSAALELGGEALWLEKVQCHTQAHVDRAALRSGQGALAELLSSIETLRGDEASLLELSDRVLADLRAKLPAELRDGDDAIRLQDSGYLGSQLDDVETLLMTRLFEAGRAR